jgi:type I restriction enzyme, S subunit
LDLNFNNEIPNYLSVNDKWEEVKLVEVCDFISRGITPSYTEENGVVVINQKCIRDNRVNLSLARLTNPEKRKIPDQKILRSYDVLVNSTGVGTLGRVAQVKKIINPMTVDSHVTIVRGNEKVHPLYLGYNLFMQQRNIENLAEGSTGQTELSRARLGEVIKLSLPSLEEQKAIGNLLSALDQKIELNYDLNKTLEEMAQTIFKRWFVDFDFPNEDGDPYKSSGGKFEERELGNIPEGWIVKSLGDLIEIVDNRGKTPPLANEKTPYPIIDVKGLSGENRIINFNNCIKFVEKETYENWFRSGHPTQEDILLSTVGSIGEMKFYMGNIGCIAQNVVALRSVNISPFYLYQYLRYIKNDLISYNIGSVQPSIKITHLIKHNILIPKKDIQTKFNNIIKFITDAIYNNSKQISSLSNLRDTLLPKLMSGKIRIPDAEQEVEVCLQKSN